MPPCLMYQILDPAGGRKEFWSSQKIFTFMSASSLEPAAISDTLEVDQSVPASSPVSVRVSSSAYPSVCTRVGGVGLRSTPLPCMLSCNRRMYSSAMMKNRGDIMSPCNTPRLIGNSSVLTFLPSESGTVVNAEAERGVHSPRHYLILFEVPVFPRFCPRIYG